MNNLTEIINSNNFVEKITKIICPNPTHEEEHYAIKICKKCKSSVCEYCIIDSKEYCIMCSYDVDFSVQKCYCGCGIELEHLMCYFCGKSGECGWHRSRNCINTINKLWDFACCDFCYEWG